MRLCGSLEKAFFLAGILNAVTGAGLMLVSLAERWEAIFFASLPMAVFGVAISLAAVRLGAGREECG